MAAAGGISRIAGGFDSGSGPWQGALILVIAPRRDPHSLEVSELDTVVKPEWGAKRTCPKCGTRFYDLGNADPVTCIECGTNWDPDPVLKSKQPLPFDAPKPAASKEAETADVDEDLDVDEDAETNADDDVDLGGDEDIDIATGNDEDEH